MRACRGWHETSNTVVHEATAAAGFKDYLARPGPKPTEEEREPPMNKIIKKVRGASMVEYALLLVAILLLAAGAFKALGPKVGTAATRSGSQL